MDVCANSLECISNAGLSPITIKTYKDRLNYITTNTRASLYNIISNPKKYILWIKNHSSSLQTQKSYISAILAIFKHTPKMKDTEKAHYHEWYGAFKTIHDKIEDRYKLNSPSDKQKEAYVPYKEIVEKRDTLKKGSKERLVLSMYTYLPPLRSDFNKVFIYKKEYKTYEHDNYIILLDKKYPSTLILNEFKTKKKDTYVRVLPEKLVDEINESLKLYPRDWLFIDRSGGPYSSGSFTKWTNRTLKSLFNRALTISLIRHSFINNLDFNTLTVKEKEDIAKDMTHTVDTQDRYRLIFP